MTIADLFKELMDSAKDRVKTPIAGSFMLAFLIYNWRPLFLLMFSDAIMEDKIMVINNEYCSLDAVLVPFLLATFYVAGVQYVMWLFDKITKKSYEWRKVNKYERQEYDLKQFRKVLQEQKTNEDIRSGNLDKIELNDKIEKLSKQNENLILQSKKDADANELAISNLESEIADRTRHEVDLENLYSLADKRIEHLLIYTPFSEALTQMNSDDLVNFVEYVKFYIGMSSGMSISAHYETKFIRLGLVVDDKGSVTEIGRKLFEYLTVK